LGDIADIAGVVITGAKILEANTAQSMGRAHALPKSVINDPDLVRDWHSNQEIGFRISWSSPMARAGISSPTTLDVLINWDFGGKMNGAGLFIKDAYSYCTVHSIGATYHYDIKADYDMPSYTGDPASPVAYIEGMIHVEESRTLTGLEKADSRAFVIRGDGSGEVGPWKAGGL